MRSKIIEFSTEYEHLELPKPTRQYIPVWYKKADKFFGGKPAVQIPGALGSPTIKICVPFLDSLTTGYIIELWQDVLVTKTENGPQFNWGVKPDVLEVRDPFILQNMPQPIGHLPTAYAWKQPYEFRTPKGYSVLITHPFNRFELPFTTLTGIVDSDKGVSRGSIPFFFNKDFEGVIPVGTPLMLVFPFKRDDWKLKKNTSLTNIGSKLTWFVNRVSFGYYQKNIWVKKTFN